MWLGSHKMVQLMKSDGESMVGVKECLIEDNFGFAREWLMYEMLAYYIQMSQLILFLVLSETKNMNIYEEESRMFT